MTYKILNKYQNIAGDWSVSIKYNDYTIGFLFNSDPTQTMLDGAVQNFIDNPPPDFSEVEDDGTNE